MEYSVGHENEENALLEQLFGSSLFGTLFDMSSRVPVRLRERAISIVADQEEYFKAHPEQLKSALEMMFKTVHIPALTTRSAAAIRNLSDGGRKHLTPIISPLLDATKALLLNNEIDSNSKRNLIKAVGYVVQTLPAFSSDQVNILTTMLDILVYAPAFNTTEVSGGEQRHRQQMRALRNLAALGAALQPPEKVVIVLDEDDEESSATTGSPSLQAFNGEVLKSLAFLMTPRDDGALLEAACGVLSVGYKERPPGYFQFLPSVTADLITSVPMTNSRLDEAVRTAMIFLSSRSIQADRNDEAKLRLIAFVGNVIQALDAPQNDPELANYCVSFVSRLVPMHTGCLSKLEPGYVPLLFGFTLKALRSQDFLPKRQASQLWNALVGMSNQHDSGFISNLLQEFGAELTRSLIFCFGGEAARSELDILARTFRKLRTKIPASKQWAEAALVAADFPSHRVSEDEKRRFMAQTLVSRDDRTTERIVKDFWTLCRGTPKGYS